MSWFWTTSLPPELLAIAPGFGVHPSLLPRHRGPDPFFRAIDAGDKRDRRDRASPRGRVRHGGDPRRSARCGSTRRGTRGSSPARSTARRCAPPRALARRPWPARPPGRGARDPRAAPEDDELEIDWTWTSERIAPSLRAASPWPGAWTFFGDEPVTITRAAIPVEGSRARSCPARRRWRRGGGRAHREPRVTLLDGRWTQPKARSRRAGRGGPRGAGTVIRNTVPEVPGRRRKARQARKARKTRTGEASSRAR